MEMVKWTETSASNQNWWKWNFVIKIYTPKKRLRYKVGKKAKKKHNIGIGTIDADPASHFISRAEIFRTKHKHIFNASMLGLAILFFFWKLARILCAPNEFPFFKRFSTCPPLPPIPLAAHPDPSHSRWESRLTIFLATGWFVLCEHHSDYIRSSWCTFE